MSLTTDEKGTLKEGGRRASAVLSQAYEGKGSKGEEGGNAEVLV